jgi:hypothetical protein
LCNEKRLRERQPEASVLGTVNREFFQRDVTEADDLELNKRIVAEFRSKIVPNIWV